MNPPISLSWKNLFAVEPGCKGLPVPKEAALLLWFLKQRFVALSDERGRTFLKLN